MLKEVNISLIIERQTYLDNVDDFDAVCYKFMTIFVLYLSIFPVLSFLLGLLELSLPTLSRAFYGDGFIIASFLNFLSFYPIICNFKLILITSKVYISSFCI